MDFFRFIVALPPGGSSVADDIDLLHAFVIGVTMLASVGIFAIAIWFAIRYKKRGPAVTPRVQATVPMEVLIIGGILSTFLLWWVIGFVQFARVQRPPDDATVVYVTAKQWMWKFEYPDGASSNDVLVVPAGRPVKLVMISRDVIHSFYVPAFRLKQDVLPGRYTTLWFEAKPGTYPVFCAEYCGVSHSRMRAEVRALEEADYARWLDERTTTGPTPLAAQGAEVAGRRGCLACHTLNGQPHVGPTWSRLYMSRVELEDGTTALADDEYLTRSMMEPQADVVAGYPQVMPTYAGQLSPTEVSALVELIRALRDGEIPAGVELPALRVEAAGPLPEPAPIGPDTLDAGEGGAP